MHIILINHYAGSTIHGMEYRPFYLAREWVKSGHQVSVIAASFSHLRSKEPSIDHMITSDEINGVDYIWIKTPSYKGNGLGRVINISIFSIVLYLLKSKLLISCKPDIVIASSPHPFIIFGAYKIARYYGAKLIFEVRDLWPLTLSELGGMSPHHPFIRLMQWSENFAYRKADRIVSLLPKAKGYMTEHGMELSKFFYIPNGIDLSADSVNSETVPQYHDEIFSMLKKEKKFIVGYAGAHGLANDLYTLIDAAILLRSYPVSFVLVGQGPEKENLQQKAIQANLHNVIFLPSVKKAAIRNILPLMDVLYIGLKNESLFRFGISPNKLMDYMMASRPILHAINAGNDMVSESGCGISVMPEAPRAVADAIIKFRNMSSEERTSLGAKGKRYVMKNHDYKVLAEKFLEGID